MWRPDTLAESRPVYRAIVDALAADVAAGTLEPGTRLPTVRALADEIGVNVNTVYHAYTLAERLGLVSKEVGRGTFVRAQPQRPVTGAADDGDGSPVDLTRNEPPYVALEGLLRRTLAEIARDAPLDGILEYGHSQGLDRHRAGLARWLAGRGFDADPDRLIITGGAQQGLTVALGALMQPGDTLLVEQLTYQGVRNLARFFGLRLAPLPLDGEGVDPDAVAAAARETGARALYLMPYAQNPTTATMSAGRRAAIAETAERFGLTIIEDDVNFRDPDEAWTPIAAEAPGRTVHIASLSKTVAPGLRVGVIVPPPDAFDEMLAASQTTSWMAPPLMAELACQWIESGIAADLTERRIAIARGLLDRARAAFGDVPVRAHPANTHLWVPLGAGRSSREFAEAAAAEGVLVTPATEFAIDAARAPAGVRLCLTGTSESRLDGALAAVARLAQEPGRLRTFRM